MYMEQAVKHAERMGISPDDPRYEEFIVNQVKILEEAHNLAMGVAGGGIKGVGKGVGAAVKGVNKITSKISSQMSKRGWSTNMIDDVISNPYTTRPAMNKATGNAATAYYNKAGDYVVRENATGNIVQISEYGNKRWIPDSSIANPYKP